MTEQWLDDNGVPYSGLYMRKAQDYSHDADAKRIIYVAEIKDRYDVLFVLEDRTSCVEMWRDLGLQCFQVAPGDF